MHRIVTGIVAFTLTFVALGLSQPTSSLAAETDSASLTVQDVGLGHAQPAMRLGGASGGVLGDRHIGEEIPQRA